MSLLIVAVTLFFFSIYGIYVVHKEAISDPYYVDASTVVKLKDGYYSKDKNSVQYVYQRIDNADYDTFDVIEGVYAKDQYSVYYSGSKINDTDLATFMVLGAHYSEDKNSVYYGVDKLYGADPATFEILRDLYSKDANSVYSWLRFR